MSFGWLSLASSITGVASNITSLGFGAAKASTRFGFSIARGIAGIVPIPLLTTSLDRLECLSLLPILLGESIASTSLSAASTSLNTIANLWQANDEASFSLASFVAIVRNEWAEHNTAGRSVTAVARAVAAWAAIQGFTRQWSEERWMKGTKELTIHDLKPLPKPSDISNPPARPLPKRTLSKVSVTDDILTPGRFSQIVSADIGEKDATMEEPPLGSPSPTFPAPFRSNYDTWKNLRRLSKIVLAGYGGAGLLFFGTPLHPEPKLSKQRKHSEQSKRTDSEVKHSEENILVHVVEDAEAESMSPPLRHVPFPTLPTLDTSLNQHECSINDTDDYNSARGSSSYSWWNVLLGKHDRDIFEGFAFMDVDESDTSTVRSPVSSSSTVTSSPVQTTFLPPSTPSSSTMSGLLISTHEESNTKVKPKRPTAIIGAMQHMPRFWVLTDHGRRQVVVVVRGTMSFTELAADLTCEPEVFEPATASSPAAAKPSRSRQSSTASDTFDSNGITMAPRAFTSVDRGTTYSTGVPHDQQSKESPLQNQSEVRFTRLNKDSGEEDTCPYEVHGGMLQLARVMGSIGKPVHDAVYAALSKNRGYELVLCGHSLGAGVASLMALMWADPKTCRTVPSSGLPVNRRVSVYCFAPPCITSASLSRLCRNLITSIVYSYDVVSRLSLGSVRDLNKAAFWLCEAKGEESTVNLLRRALRGKLGFGGPLVASDTEDEKKWFTAVRKTLEANMSFAHLYPPGRVWWTLRNEALHPLHQSSQVIGKDLRLFEIQEVETVFRQIEFKGDMLSSHLPHQYVRMLTELEF